ncbi:hypothetical protein [Tardiphaga alba]|uniref:hypothetical protein n=1 Tax=Tardiphaga alba TaxID=340268 RepID=UPI0038B586CB
MLGRAGIATILVEPHHEHPPNSAARRSPANSRSTASTGPACAMPCSMQRPMTARSGWRGSAA